MNTDHSRVPWLAGMAAAVVLGGLLLSACRQSPSSPVPTVPAEPSAGASAQPTGQSVESAPTAVSLPSAGTTLIWWTPEFFSPEAPGTAGEVLAGQVAGFVAAHPDISVQPILKAAHGKGGILDFLRTASAAAPSILPDVVTIDTSDMAAAVQTELPRPLDDMLSAELRGDLFPFALSSGQFDGQWYGVQFEADVEHLVYRTDRVREPPRTWDELLSGSATYIFAAGGRQELVNDASLMQYLGAGGGFDPATRQLSLKAEPLEAVLRLYQQGRERQLIPAEVLTFHSPEACWPAFLAEQADMTNVLASRYLAERGAYKDTSFAALPTRDGQTVAISRGWALAIVAKDATRRQAAALFVEWLLAPDNSAAWTRAASRLPTRGSALDLWGTEDGYYTFLRSQLQAAVFRPGGRDSIETTRRLQQATRSVLSGVASPEEAVSQALEGLGQ